MPGIYACAGVFDLKPGERGRKRRPLPRRPAGNARVLPHPDPAYFDAARLLAAQTSMPANLLHEALSSAPGDVSIALY